jgi:hypothetical protein
VQAAIVKQRFLFTVCTIYFGIVSLLAVSAMVDYEADPRKIVPPLERFLDWLKPVGILWLIFLAINLSWLSGLNFHVDNEISAIRIDPLIWLEQGRWGAYLFERFVLPQSFLATFPVAFYGLMGCFAYLLILNSVGVKYKQLRICDYLLFPIFISFPSITFLFSYSANIAMQGLALLLTAASARVFARCMQPDRRAFVGEAVLVLIWGAFAISLYQTNVLLLWASLMVPVLFCLLADAAGQDWKIGQALKAFFLALLLSAGAFGLYWLAEINWLNKLHLSLFYIQSLVDQSLFLKAPLSVMASNWSELVNLIGGAVPVFGTSGRPLGLLVLFSLLIVLVNLFKGPSPLNSAVKVLLLFGFLISPIAFGLLLKIPAPVRSIVSLPLVVWFIVWMAQRLIKRLILARGMVAILACGLINLFYVISYRASSNQLIQAHDLGVAEAIALECARQVPGFTYKASSRYFLSLHGKLHFQNIFGPTADSDTEVSIFEIEYVRPLRVIALLRILGLADFRLVPQEEEPRLEPYFAAMPCWPSPGAVKLVGNVVLLKLGE